MLCGAFFHGPFFLLSLRARALRPPVQKKDQKKRNLAETVRELQEKVIKAAQELQQELADNAEQPALDASSTAADADPAVLVHLKERYRKRAADAETQDQKKRTNK